MAARLYNRGIHNIMSLAISGSTDIRCLVIAGASLPAGAKDVDLDSVADVLAVGSVVEAAASGYSRQDLAGVTLASPDDTNDDVELSATAPTLTSVAVGETWRMVVYYIEGASDAARSLISYDEPSSTLVTNGGNVTLPALLIRATSP